MICYSPVYFRRDSEPYMTIAKTGARKDSGVSVAEVNLKFIWDVVSQIKVGENGQAYVIYASNRLVPHPNISLVLRGSDLSSRPQVPAFKSQFSLSWVPFDPKATLNAGAFEFDQWDLKVGAHYKHDFGQTIEIYSAPALCC
jgi:hypothetical protein